MAKDEKKTIIVDDVTYNLGELTDQQKVMVNHLQDLERKLANAKFNLDQLQVGRDAFVNMLADSLKEKEEAA